MFGMVGIVVVIAVALLSPVLSPYDPISQDPNARLEAPSLGHLLGTDEFGRDILSRIFYGAVTSLEVGVGVVTIDVLLGLFLGAIAAYYGRLVDTLIMRIADIMLAFPGLVLAILLMAVLGPGIPNVVLSVSLVNWPGY